MHVFFVAKPASVFHRAILSILSAWQPALVIDWWLHAKVSVVAILATMPTGRTESYLRIAQIVALHASEIIASVIARIIALI